MKKREREREREREMRERETIVEGRSHLRVICVQAREGRKERRKSKFEEKIKVRNSS